MSVRIAFSVACVLTLSLVGGAVVVSAPSGSGSGSVELASMAAATIDPALILARHGEPADAYDLLRVSGGGEVSTAQAARLLVELKRYAEADSLLSLHTPIDDGRRLYLHQLQRAAINLSGERYDAALASLAPIGTLSEPEFDGYRDYIAMRAHLALEDVASAAQIGRAGHQRGVPDALRDRYEEALVEACQGTGDHEFAIDLTRALQKRARGWREKARFLHTEYEFHARSQNLDEARRVARVLVTRYPRYAETAAVADEICANVDAASMSEGELTAYAGFYTSSGGFDEALLMLRALDKRKLPARGREERRILYAEYHYRTGNYDRAAALATPSYDTPAFKRRSVLVLARSYRRSDRDRQSARLYEYFARTFPNDGKSAEALFVAGRIYHRLGDDAGYRRVLDRLTRAYPSSYYGRSAALMAAKRHSEHGEHDASTALLSRLVKRSRGGDEAALYYLAQSYQSSGDEEHRHLILKQLEALDPFSFYLSPRVPEDTFGPQTASNGAVALDGSGGLLEFLERGNRDKAAAYERIEAALAEDVTESDSTFAACVKRGEWFLSVGLREWGERELETARRGCFDSAGRILELGRIYDRYAMPWQSVRMYERVRGRMPWSRRGEFAGDFRLLLYPVPYPVQVLENSARFDVPPHLAFAMIREESLFDLEAVSRVGALGLMQIMPATGQAIARELELPGWVEDDLLNPEVNVAFGVWYASSLLDASGGDPLWMLAAYNAGPGNARRWFGGRGARGPIDAVDNIDFKETRLYVQRIVESANIYHTLYFGADAVGAQPPR